MSNKRNEGIFYGDEHTWTTEAKSFDTEMTKALNWYSYISSPLELKKFTLEYLKKENYDKEIINIISKLHEDLFRHVGGLARIVYNGCPLSERYKISFQKKLDVLLSVKEVKKDDVPEKKKVSVQDHLINKARSIAGELEFQIDKIFETSESNFNVYKWLSNNFVSGSLAKKISSLFENDIKEFENLVEGIDDELTEAYGSIRKPVLKKVLKFYHSIEDACQKIISNSKGRRTPTKKKAPSFDKIIKNFSYKDEDTNFQCKSINPLKILQAKELWIFDTKYKNFIIYCASNENHGLNIKGKSIIDFCEKASVGKKLRKPDEFISLAIKSPRKALSKAFEKLKTKKYNPNGRINNNCILLKVFN